MHKGLELGLVALLAVVVVFLAFRPSADSATSAAQNICTKNQCQSYTLAPNKLEARIAEFMTSDGKAIHLMLIFDNGKFVGSVSLD